MNVQNNYLEYSLLFKETNHIYVNRIFDFKIVVYYILEDVAWRYNRIANTSLCQASYLLFTIQNSQDLRGLSHLPRKLEVWWLIELKHIINLIEQVTTNLNNDKKYWSRILVFYLIMFGALYVEHKE